ncbi:hypothetical protein QUF70_02950 [Desulfobacterales bacterium HSG17]|nr:hypothetical protein [Desulfobacterales bacterium HSG17]
MGEFKMCKQGNGFTKNWRCLFFALLFGLVICIGSLPVAAQETDTETGETGEEGVVKGDEPVFKNVAEADKVENLSEAWAAQLDPELKEKLDAEQAAGDEVERLETEGAPQEEIDAAKAEFDDAQTAVAEAFGDVALGDPDDIMEMRESGMGWGQIAHELNVHPSVLGRGHQKTNRWQEQEGIDSETGETDPETEIETATKRDLKRGMSGNKHGLSVSGDNSRDGGKSMGVDKVKESKGKSVERKESKKSSGGSSVSKGNNGKSNSGNANSNKGGNSKGKSKGNSKNKKK